MPSTPLRFLNSSNWKSRVWSREAQKTTGGYDQRCSITVRYIGKYVVLDIERKTDHSDITTTVTLQYDDLKRLVFEAELHELNK